MGRKHFQLFLARPFVASFAAGGVFESCVRHVQHQQVGGGRGNPHPVVDRKLRAAAGQRGKGPVHPPRLVEPQLGAAQRSACRQVPPPCQELRRLRGEEEGRERARTHGC